MSLKSMTLFTHRRTIDGSHDNDNDTEEPGPKPKDKSYCLPKLILYLVAVATIGTNLRSILNLDEGNRVGVGVGVMAVNRNRTKRTTTIIQLASSTNNTHEHTLAEYSSAGSFFDCNRTQSKCRYFYPGAFFRQYFTTALKQTTSSSSSIGNGNGNGNSIYHQSNASSSEQQYLEWRKHIGLENANLPALDSLSWWAEEEGDSDSNIDESGNERSILNHQLLSHQIQTHINIPSNITYIHVHKCGGTSIQGALYRSARRIRNTHFQIINNGSTRSDDNNNNRSNNNNNNHNQQQLIQIQANVHTYKHSYGGGSREKKERWDKERLDHIHAISDINNETRRASFPLFTVVRDPIQRFLSAVQQVMHYNTEFREKCLKDSLSSSTLTSTSTSTVSSSSSSIIAPLLLSKKSKEEKEAQLRRQTIQCAIRDMEETTYRRDVHLLPMASHFRLMGDDATTEDDEVGNDSGNTGIIRKDISISVFFMEDIEDVLLHLLGNVVKDDNNISNTTSKKSIIHARDRSNVEYATSSILARLSSNDCDNDMIQQICNLYHVDVELIKWLGFGGEAVERCE